MTDEDKTQNTTKDKPKREFFIFQGNLAEAREAFGENLAIRDTGLPIKQVYGYSWELREVLENLDSCGIIHAIILDLNKRSDISEYYSGVPVYRTPIAI